MNLPRYDYTTEDFQEYSFFSVGPKGKIKKIIRFQLIQDHPEIYNLAFGDENDLTGDIDDSVVSNNLDSDIVLATVASTVIEFCNHYGDHFIFAKGSTPGRTRLYQMGIGRLFSEISKEFYVYGIIEESMYLFKPNVNYDAFLVRRK